MASRSAGQPRAAPALSQTKALAGPSASSADHVGTQAANDASVDVDLLGSFLLEVIEVAQFGRRLSRSQLDDCRRRGEDAAERGVALPALLDLYLSAMWRLWADVDTRATGASAAAVTAVAAAMFRAADDAIEALAAGYEATQYRTVRFEESLRREFVDDLLSGTGDPDLLRERAARFGFNLASTHHVAVARTERVLMDAGPVHTRVEAQVLASFGGRDVVVATKEGLLVCVFPGGAANAAVDLARTLDESGEGPWRIGVGRPHPGSGGLVRSYGEARHSLDLADRATLTEPVARFEDLLALRMLAADPHVAAELVETVLGPLKRARGGAEHLVETLDAHFASSGNVSATARALHLSPRAVTYRLERIAELTGHSPQEPDGRFILELAVRSHRLAGPNDPAETEPPRSPAPLAAVEPPKPDPA